MEMYSVNDWRDYLEHKYDWSTGKNPPDYNHDYYEKNKERILANRKGNGGVRDFGGSGVGYKSRSKDGSSYEDMDDWDSELTDEERKNIDAHNKQVEANIAQLTKTVNDYINANKDKLSPEQIKKLQSDLNTQTEIAREQMISTKNSSDKAYIMDLRKKNNAAKAASGGSKKSTPKKATSTKSQQYEQRVTTSANNREAAERLTAEANRRGTSNTSKDVYEEQRRKSNKK